MEPLNQENPRCSQAKPVVVWRLQVFILERKPDRSGQAAAGIVRRRVRIYAPWPEAALPGLGAHRDEQCRPGTLRFWELFAGRAAVSQEELGDFFQTLGAALSSGCSLTNALSMGSRQALSARLRGVIGGLSHLVGRGVELHHAMECFPQVFAPAHIALARAAGQLGLDQAGAVFLRLAARTRGDTKLGKKIAGALAYPVFILILSVFASLILELKALPPMVELFKAMGAPLPPITQAFYSIARVLAEHFLLVATLVSGLFASAVVYGPRLVRQRFVQSLSYRLWVLGDLIRSRAIARALSIFALLKASGANSRDIFALSAAASGHAAIADYFQSAYRRVANGESLEEAFLAERHLLGDAGLRLSGKIELGMETGKLPELLESLAEDFHEHAEAKAALLPRALELPMLLFCGLLIGSIMLAMFLPYPSLLGDIARQMRPGG